MQQIIIRYAEQSDWSAIQDLSAALGYSALSDLAAAANLEVILQSEQHQVLLAELDGLVVGWLHLLVSQRIASPFFAEIGGLAVDASQRRQGIGRRLLEAAGLWAGSQGMTLRVRCNNEREATLAFYRACGYSDLKTQCVLQAPA